MNGNVTLSYHILIYFTIEIYYNNFLPTIRYFAKNVKNTMYLHIFLYVLGIFSTYGTYHVNKQVYITIYDGTTYTFENSVTLTDISAYIRTSHTSRGIYKYNKIIFAHEFVSVMKKSTVYTSTRDW